MPPGEKWAVAQQQIRVLVVEDSETQQRLVREWLSGEMLPADEPASFAFLQGYAGKRRVTRFQRHFAGSERGCVKMRTTGPFRL